MPVVLFTCALIVIVKNLSLEEVIWQWKLQYNNISRR